MVLAASVALRQRFESSSSKLQQILLILAARKLKKQKEWLCQLQLLADAGLLTPQVPKSREYFELLMDGYNNERFRQTLRVSRKTFAWLRTKLYDDIEPAESGRPRMEASLRMAVGLYRLAHKCHVRTIAAQFGICEGSVVNLSYEFIELVATKLKAHITYDPKSCCLHSFCRLQVSGHARAAAVERGHLRAEVWIPWLRCCHGWHVHHHPPSQRAPAARLLQSEAHLRCHHARRLRR